MALQGFALLALSAVGLATLLYYMYASNAAPEQPYSSDPYVVVSPSFDNWSENTNSPNCRSNKERSNSNRRKRQSNRSRQIPEADCTICLQNIKDGERTLPCNHRFHVECIKHWESSQGSNITCYTCPNCRKSYVSK